MQEHSPFYDSVYENFGRELAATIRAEVFDEDIGQNSWLTADEHRTFCECLGLHASSRVLEIASGSGGPALFMVGAFGCTVIGLEQHAAGVKAANAAAEQRGLAARAQFLRGDARDPLRFADDSFDAVICIDSINHMYERQQIFEEWRRVLRVGGRVLFTDPMTVTGMIRREEMLIRSGSLGEQVFTPSGVNEALLRVAGFRDVRVRDVTANMAAVSAARLRARAGHAAELDRLEGVEERAAYDRYLCAVGLLASERRLTRIALLASERAMGAAAAPHPWLRQGR